MTLRLALVELANVRRFSGRWQVGPFAPGLNVLAAPNEAGKSTLLAAIQAAIFFPHRTMAEEAKRLRSFDDGVPEVSLVLDDGARRWTIRKRFAGTGGKVELSSSGRSWAGDAAEEEIRRLFGVAATQGKRDVPRGVWGALWVEQRGSFAQPDLDPVASATLKDALGAEVRVVTGGAGARRILSRIAKLLEEVQTPTGRPTGALKAAIERQKKAEAKRLELETTRNDLEHQLDEVARLRAEIARRMAERREERLQAEHIAAEQEANDLAAAAKRRRLAEEVATQAEALAHSAEAAVRVRSELTRDVGRRREEAETANRRCEEAAAKLQAAEAEARSAREALAAAKARLEQAEAAAAHARTLAALSRQAKAAQEARAKAQAATEALAALARAEAERDAIVATPQRLAAIERADQTLRLRRGEALAEAPRLSLSVAPGATVLRDGAALPEGETTVSVLSQLVLEVPGVLRLVLEPGRRERAAAIAEAEQDLAAALRAAGAEDVAAARAAAERWQGLETEATRLRAHLVGLLGHAEAEAVAHAEARAKALGTALEHSLRELALSGIPDETLAETELAVAEEQLAGAKAARERAEDALASLAEAEQAAREAAMAAEAERNAAVREAERAEKNLADARAEAPDDTLAERAEAARRHAEERAAERDRVTAPDTAALEAARARAERLAGQLKAERDAAKRDEVALGQALGHLEALEALGLDEAIAEAKAEEARAKAGADALAARARALVLLRDTIAEAEREATQRYLEPVAKTLEPWLARLLPGARVELADTLAVTALARTGRSEPFDLLSAGTQEQIAVLVRLAFAQLLERQGNPAPVILDDALVFSDDARIERMFEVLEEAAKSLQIVVLTCRQGLFSRLSAHRLAFERVA